MVFYLRDKLNDNNLFEIEMWEDREGNINLVPNIYLLDLYNKAMKYESNKRINFIKDFDYLDSIKGNDDFIKLIESEKYHKGDKESLLIDFIRNQFSYISKKYDLKFVED